MYDILLPIKPYYAYLIMKGKKTIEVRKFTIKNPNWSGKFKCYVSKDKTSLKRIPQADRAEFEKYLGKVAYEFACNKVDKVINHGSNFKIIDESIGYTNRVAEQSRLDFYDLKKYLETKDGYAWHITDIKVYDKPKALHHFFKPCGDCSKKDTMRCTEESTDCRATTITRPPQSWQYIQELED